MGHLYKQSGSRNWYGKYYDASGRIIRRSTKTRNKQDAQKILTQWERDANLVSHGIHSTSASIYALIDQYLDFIGSSGDTYRTTCEHRIKRIIIACDFQSPQDIDAVAVQSAVQRFLTEGRKATQRTISARSQAHYLTAFKAFVKWLVHTRRVLPRDPLATIRKPTFEHARSYRRRYLLPEEWQWLKQTEHALLYETAIQTGLRSNELRHLRPHHVYDTHLLLPAEHTKNKKPAKQYISAKLSTQLRESLPFEMPPKHEIARMLYADLESAHAMWTSSNPRRDDPNFLQRSNAAGEVLDFHALRHTCGAWLALAGVSIKTIQAVMRHSTITLTLDTYGHLLPGAESDAAAKLSEMLG